MATKQDDMYSATHYAEIPELNDNNSSSDTLCPDEAAEENERYYSNDKRSNINVLTAYLHEIKRWPILSKDGEQILAQKLSAAEQNKMIYAEQWADLYTDILDWNKIKKVEQQLSPGRPNRICLLLALLRSIKHLTNQIRQVEHTISAEQLTYYKSKKLCREKAHYIIRKNEILSQLDIIRVYKAGEVAALKPHIKTNLSKKTKSNLLHSLREFIKHDKKARASKQELVRSNLRLVVGIAKKYAHANRGLGLPDLIQEGNIGLMKAIDKFDYRLGNRLSTYASWWIRQSIIRSIEDKSSTIRVPVYINGRIKKLLKNMHETDIPVALENGSENDEEFKNLFSAFQVMKDPLSLETPFADDGSNLHECIPDMMPPSPLDQVLRYQLLEETEDVLKNLHPRDERVLRLRFGLGVETEHTLEEIGEEFGISRERIRQIETTALRKIKDSISSDSLRLYLGK